MTLRMPAPTSLRVLWSDGEVVQAEGADTMLHLGDEATTDALDRLYAIPHRPWVRMNMLGTLNARATGPDGTSDSISNRADRAILKRIRAMSDAIIVGAETVRQEPRMGIRDVRLVIVTASGNLHGHGIAPEQVAHGVTVICPAAAAAEVERTMPGAAMHHPPGERVAVAAILAWCRDEGLDSLVVEGGANLIEQFLDAEAIDEVCITQAPVFGRSDEPGLPGSGAERRFRRALIAVDDLGFVYSRLVAEPASPS